jgi:hypothetical protein
VTRLKAGLRRSTRKKRHAKVSCQAGLYCLQPKFLSDLPISGSSSFMPCFFNAT